MISPGKSVLKLDNIEFLYEVFVYLYLEDPWTISPWVDFPNN